MRCFMGLFMAILLLQGCNILQEVQDPAQDPDAAVDEPPERSINFEQVLDTGIMLRSPEEDWGAHLFFPVGIGWTEFDLQNISLDQVSTISAIPTAEFIVPLSKHWTLMIGS